MAGNAVLLDGSRVAFPNTTNGCNRRIVQSMHGVRATKYHPYVYGVLVFEAIATFVGQVSVLSLVALFGAATTLLLFYHLLLYLKLWV
ncbi:hypothetical protein QVD17_41330 [Tagetes erecta]|uniref:Uncharacterized protein n=1 Tax=Tagetes erecta TaxID=13708 RepID=A0AAD8NGL4_TARER|nr:hypothetical protein QVD17_41330 [Tagetes erecta]